MYKNELYQEKSHGYHFCTCKSMADKLYLGEYLQFLIEFVAKLHEHRKIKFSIMHLFICVFLFFVAPLVN